MRCGFVIVDSFIDSFDVLISNILCANFRISGRVSYVII